MKKLLLFSSFAFLAGPVQSTCTQVIGYSQVGQNNGGWFVTGGAFEAEAGDSLWQLLWNGGAGVDKWQNPGYSGWNNTIISPCSQNSQTPNRVLLSISGPFGTDTAAWARAIDSSVGIIKQKLPSVSQIILQPVVGGPGHSACPVNGSDSVRASWQHRFVDQAIANVVLGRTDVLAGFSPEVGQCSDYRDGLGHLTAAAAAVIGKQIGEYYANSSGVENPTHLTRNGRPVVIDFKGQRFTFYPKKEFRSPFRFSVLDIRGKTLARGQSRFGQTIKIREFAYGNLYSSGIFLLALEAGPQKAFFVFPGIN